MLCRNISHISPGLVLQLVNVWVAMPWENHWWSTLEDEGCSRCWDWEWGAMCPAHGDKRKCFKECSRGASTSHHYQLAIDRTWRVNVSTSRGKCFLLLESTGNGVNVGCSSASRGCIPASHEDVCSVDCQETMAIDCFRQIVSWLPSIVVVGKYLELLYKVIFIKLCLIILQCWQFYHLNHTLPWSKGLCQASQRPPMPFLYSWI